MATNEQIYANILSQLQSQKGQPQQSFDQYVSPLIQQYQTQNPSIAGVFGQLLQGRNDAIGSTQKNLL